MGMEIKPLNQISETIHQDIVRRNYEARVEAARNADISVENRNLSQAWSFGRLHVAK